MKRTIYLLVTVILTSFSASAQTFRLATVCIDPGHGGTDPGAVSRDQKLYEKTFTLDIAKRLAEKIKAALGCEVVRFNDMGGSIETVAVCSGSGGSLLADVLANEVDAYITGDVKHDVFIDAYNAGLTVFDAGHFHTEDIFVDYMADKLKERFPELNVLRAPSDRDILSYT